MTNVERQKKITENTYFFMMGVWRSNIMVFRELRSEVGSPGWMHMLLRIVINFTME